MCYSLCQILAPQGVNFGRVTSTNQICGELVVEHYTNRGLIFFPFISHVFHIKLYFLFVLDTSLLSVGGQVLY